MRDEKTIFSRLAQLCVSKGYAHVIAWLYVRDAMFSHQGQITPQDMLHLFSKERLIRTEISTLIGLMYKGEIDLLPPDIGTFDRMLEETESLLKELHQSMCLPTQTQLISPVDSCSGSPSFVNNFVLREAIFYGGESAYNFQYSDFSERKYKKDNDWLKLNKGFFIEEARVVINCIGVLQDEKISNHFKGFDSEELLKSALLPAFIFSHNEVAGKVGVKKDVVDKILQAFVPPKENQGFGELNDFNITNAYPLIDLGNGEYLLFQKYSLVEALYETPYYWICEDDDYFLRKARHHRGAFTEEFSAERLKLVFGEQRVFSNVQVFDSQKPKKGRRGEIDVLVVFADRAIIVQTKSKRLSLESRRGNDNVIKDDFKKSIQDSYDQGLLCANLLHDENYTVSDANSRKLKIPRQYKEIYVFCVISDHYPALSFQSRLFLKWDKTPPIMPPFVMDIFFLDVITEMLQSPLRFLSYINRRLQYFDKILATKERTILSYHLKQNLWMEDDTFFYLEDDISTDIDLAMHARRDGIPAELTPQGVLTHLENTVIGYFLQQIENSEDPVIIELGFMLLTLSEETILELSHGLETIASLTRLDKSHHDITIGAGSTGLTIHCNDDPVDTAKLILQGHCERRKYACKANEWFGICVDPERLSLKFALRLDYQWEASKEMDTLIKSLLTTQKIKDSNKAKKVKTGRNDPCFCGSGIKFKKCCLWS